MYLCSTARLARALHITQQHTALARGAAIWQPVPTLTLGQFLAEVIGEGLLQGEIGPEQLPALTLSPQQELILWERAIGSVLDEEPMQALFDAAGMAAIAREANHLLEEWHIRLPEAGISEETRQFLRWRAAFRAECARHDALELGRLFGLYLKLLKRGAGRLPERIFLAGFDRINPQQQQLFDVLTARGVQVRPFNMGLAQPAQAVQIAYDDVEAECRAAAAWAASLLAENPQRRLAIVATDLSAVHARLCAALDDSLHPISVLPAYAEVKRCYDFSLGTTLACFPMVACALALLRAAMRHHHLVQQEVSTLLRNVYWSASVREADARACLEVRMRCKLPATLKLEQVLGLARHAEAEGLGVSQLVRHLAALLQQAAAWPRRQGAAAWAVAFTDTLAAAGWPGERPLSSNEFQASQAWLEVLAELAALDVLLGQIGAEQALYYLNRLCCARIFQLETEGEAPLQVLGMLETAAAPFDAMWVLGMNDYVWPPPARPNPLLPVAAQRMAGAPNSCCRVQAEFAAILQHRLLHSAPFVVFSWARRADERELRPSPLLAGLPVWQEAIAPAISLSKRLTQKAEIEWLDDHRAPPLLAGERVRGGTSLLRAQAICPAWAFYRYRLGARALDEVVEGLDRKQRGSLLHAVLQCFWSRRDSAWLKTLHAGELEDAVHAAVDAGVSQFAASREAQLPAQFLALERQRLCALLMSYLKLEQQRKPFAVQECERRMVLEIAGLGVEMVLDRVDTLEDGRLLLLDYKTGVASTTSWAQPRISEPQLPIYAALALSEQEVAAVCFAQLRMDEQKFVGIAADSGLLPGVHGLEGARKLFPQQQFPDWQSLLEHWRTSIIAIAEEIRAGEAAVRFTNEAELDYCEVKPLLRLPERRLQLERSQQ